VRAPTSIKLPPDCWAFIQDMRALPSPLALPADLHEILGAAPRMEVSSSIPEPRFVVEMSPLQAEALQRWLHALFDGLAVHDRRRVTCLQCISRVAVAIRLSQI
jgi:hypothetical protein